MEALYFFKFWKQSSAQRESHCANTPAPSTVSRGENEVDGDEGDDSFFELELASANLDVGGSTPKHIMENGVQESCSYRFELDDDHNIAAMKGANKVKKASQDLADSISKRKILPIEPFPKPQSPISLLKSAPSFKVLTFKKSKSIARSSEMASLAGSYLKEMEYGGASTPARAGNGRLRQSNHSYDSLEANNRDVVVEESRLGRYLKLIRPFYVKLSRRTMGNTSPPEYEPFAYRGPVPCQSPGSPLVSASPRKGSGGSGIRVTCKRLAKGKSAASQSMPASTRRDDNLVLQHDGIQGAILYCKKSFNSSKDSAAMTRFGSEALRTESEVSESPRTSGEVI